MQRKSQGAFEYILLLGGILLIVVVSVIIMRNSVLNQANQQLGGNIDAYRFQNCIPQYLLNPDSVVAHWSFDEGSGNIAHEMKGHDGTLQGTLPKWVPGKSGNALEFDGNNWVSAASSCANMLSFSGINKVTIAAWIKTTSSTTQVMLVQNGPVFFMMSGGKFGGPNVFFSPWTPAYGTSNIATGQWTHVAQTIDSSGNIKMYVNGMLEGTASKSPGLNSGPGKTYIGRSDGGCPGCGGCPSAGYFNGAIDELTIYNRALKQEEIC